MTSDSRGFVPLSSLRGGAADPQRALEKIRHIYFHTSRRTIENDFAHAIELLKSLPTEDERARAHVYMEGLAEMRKEWAPQEKRHSKSTKTSGKTARKKL